ncbi:class I SAM-dependent methyltransferase [Patescibacteria group bacterium]|nr:class I SAM-dependent methyltransferase [Patescibacteria group bacterium]
MINLIAPSWPDYELLETGDGVRLERFGGHLIIRPDPNILWPKSRPEDPAWQSAEAVFIGKEDSTGWRMDDRLRAGWPVSWNGLKVTVRPTPFRHVGLFPEQSIQWQWLKERIMASNRPARVLNLFAYTGAASIVAAQAGAEVCHLDASAGAIRWAKENAALSSLPPTAIRWIQDDGLKFMAREVRRGKKYDLILMDPPVFGRGPRGEIWRLEEGIEQLAELTGALLSDQPIGLLVNFYATATYPISIERVFADRLGDRLPLQAGCLCLQESFSGKSFQTGFFLRS